ncbi:short transient receptor potential channel 4-like [Glandiceps talaboti]
MKLNNNGLEQMYLTAAEKGDIHALEEALKDDINFDINVKDLKGRSALQLAVENGRLEVIAILIKNGVQIGDTLLHAVDAKFKKAVELLLNNSGDQDIINSHASEDNDDFHPDITPIILAAQQNDYDIIKVLQEKGAPQITLSDLHTEKHTVQRSVGTLNIYKALASEAYISFIELEKKEKSDPFGRAFELSAELRRMSSLEYEFRKEYLDLADQCELFAAELIGQTRDTDELRTVLNHESKGSTKTVRQKDLPSKVVYAVKKEQKKFVTHPYCQQELIERWYRGLPDWRDSSKLRNLLISLLIMVFFPILSLLYVFAPFGKIGRFMRVPYVKFLLHTASELLFILMLFLSTFHYDDSSNGDPDGEGSLLMMQMLSQQRGAMPTELECIIMVWIFGMVWREIKELWGEGMKSYFNGAWNLFDFVQLGMYLSWIGLRIAAYVLVHDERMSTSSLNKREANPFTNITSEVTIHHLSREHVDTRLYMHSLLDNVTAQLIENITQLVEYGKTSHQYEELSINMTTTLSRMIQQIISILPTGAPPTTVVDVDNGTFDDVSYSLRRSDWHQAEPTLIADCVMSLANVIAVLRILRIMVINEYVGPLQISFSKMMADIIKFLFIFWVIWFAFALGMTEIYWSYAAEEKLDCLNNGNSEHECGEQYFSGIGTSLMSLFWSLYGLIDLEVLHVNADHQSTEFIGEMLFAGYSIAAIVILMNLLIALMGTTYEAVVENSDTEWKYARSEMWLDYFRSGATVPPPFNMIPTPKAIMRLVQFVWNNTCARRCGREITWASRKPKVVEDNYKDVCRQLVLRYFAEKASIARDSGDSGVFKEELLTVKQDISSIRYEVYGIQRHLKETVEHFDGRSDIVTEKITQLKSHVKQNRSADHEELSEAQSELIGLTGRGHDMLVDLDEKLSRMHQQHLEKEEEAQKAMNNILKELKTDISRNKEAGGEMLKDMQEHIDSNRERESVVLRDLQQRLSSMQRELVEQEKSKVAMIGDIQKLTEKVETLSFQATSLALDDDEP